MSSTKQHEYTSQRNALERVQQSIITVMHGMVQEKIKNHINIEKNKWRKEKCKK